MINVSRVSALALVAGMLVSGSVYAMEEDWNNQQAQFKTRQEQEYQKYQDQDIAHILANSTSPEQREAQEKALNRYKAEKAAKEEAENLRMVAEAEANAKAAPEKVVDYSEGNFNINGASQAYIDAQKKNLEALELAAYLREIAEYEEKEKAAAENAPVNTNAPLPETNALPNVPENHPNYILNTDRRPDCEKDNGQTKGLGDFIKKHERSPDRDRKWQESRDKSAEQNKAREAVQVPVMPKVPDNTQKELEERRAKANAQRDAQKQEELEKARNRNNISDEDDKVLQGKYKEATKHLK